mmetsp:Transcript_3035/g.5939  ORF Transcript_3035/g.5939 Transcript_3035/m.5939 type:complete len:240 (-) Transcript_3035:434-1153(-)
MQPPGHRNPPKRVRIVRACTRVDVFGHEEAPVVWASGRLGHIHRKFKLACRPREEISSRDPSRPRVRTFEGFGLGSVAGCVGFVVEELEGCCGGEVESFADAGLFVTIGMHCNVSWFSFRLVWMAVLCPTCEVADHVVLALHLWTEIKGFPTHPLLTITACRRKVVVALKHATLACGIPRETRHLLIVGAIRALPATAFLGSQAALALLLDRAFVPAYALTYLAPSIEVRVVLIFPAGL